MKKAVKQKVREDLKKEKNNTELWLESDLSLGQAIINWKEKWKETRLKAENYIIRIPHHIGFSFQYSPHLLLKP